MVQGAAGAQRLGCTKVQVHSCCVAPRCKVRKVHGHMTGTGPGAGRCVRYRCCVSVMFTSNVMCCGGVVAEQIKGVNRSAAQAEQINGANMLAPLPGRSANCGRAHSAAWAEQINGAKPTPLPGGANLQGEPAPLPGRSKQ